MQEERVMKDEIKDWISACPGIFNVKDVDYDLGFVTTETRQKRTEILEKFVAERILSREGNRRGYYRPCITDLKHIDFVNVKEEKT